jgi:hypothetical protein
VYDGCTDPTGLKRNKDNPAGGEDTQFGKSIASAEGGRACDRHDECYQTCHHGDKSAKEKCDLQMREDMRLTCLAAEKEDWPRCWTWAKRYYALVTALGSSTYAKRQKEVCGCNEKSGSKSKDSKESQPKKSLEEPK